MFHTRHASTQDYLESNPAGKINWNWQCTCYSWVTSVC